MSALVFQTACELARLIRAGEVSATDVLDAICVNMRGTIHARMPSSRWTRMAPASGRAKPMTRSPDGAQRA